MDELLTSPGLLLMLHLQTNLCNPPSINEPTPAQIEHTFWRPSDALLKVLRILHEIDYTQFPCIPCRAHTAHVCYTLIRSSGSLAKQIPSSHLNTYILIFH